MINKNFEVYFDLGSSRIRALAANTTGTIKNFYYESDYFFNFDNSLVEIEKIISKIEKDTNEYLDSINLMVDSPEMLSISLSLSKTLDGTKFKNDDVQFLIQDAKNQVLRDYPNARYFLDFDFKDDF